MEKIIDDILEAADNNDMEKVNRLWIACWKIKEIWR